jgi:DNA-binding CsgD family transcriptional regulator
MCSREPTVQPKLVNKLCGPLWTGHDLLWEDEKVLFRRLSVFAGGWTLEAAEAVCSGGSIQEVDVLDLLGGLVDKSLVVAGASTGGALQDARACPPVRPREAGAERGGGNHKACPCRIGFGNGEAVEYAFSEEEEIDPPTTYAPEEPSAGQALLALTRREREVAALIAQGISNRQISTELSISERTAANHVAQILKKLDLHSRAHIASWVSET